VSPFRGDGLALGLARAGAQVEEEFGEGAEHACGADADADVDAPRDDGLQRLSCALRVEELERQAEAMETYFERVVERVSTAGYRWYETANFCVAADHVAGRDLRAQHNLAYWLGRDYVGLGIGAVSTLGGERRRNTPRLNAYVSALSGGEAPVREVETLDEATREQERLMLGLRLDTGLPLAEAERSVDAAALGRVERLGLATLRADGDGQRTLVLTPRGRRLGGAVTVELLA